MSQLYTILIFFFSFENTVFKCILARGEEVVFNPRFLFTQKATFL